MGYPEVAAAAGEPAEVWTPPGQPVAASIGDCHGHPLTWGAVARAHQWLVAHASCSSAGRPAAYDSDDPDATLDPPPCPCTYHPTLIEARETHLLTCYAWPGPICGTCWAASCAGCGYVFDDASDAAGRLALRPPSVPRM